MYDNSSTVNRVVAVLNELKEWLHAYVTEHPTAAECLKKHGPTRYWRFHNLLKHDAPVSDVRLDGAHMFVEFSDMSATSLDCDFITCADRAAQFKKSFPTFYRGWVCDRRRSYKKSLKSLARLYDEYCEEEARLKREARRES